VGVAG